MVFPTLMALRLFLLLLVAVALLAEAASAGNDDAAGNWSIVPSGGDDGESDGDGGFEHSDTCDLVGGCGDAEEEAVAMDSEINRRLLQARSRFISYGALNKNRVPCNRRGQSYYNCAKRGRANPYHRGCSIITRCARVLD